jgi:hypothetical protein
MGGDAEPQDVPSGGQLHFRDPHRLPDSRSRFRHLQPARQQRAIDFKKQFSSR